MTSGCPKCGYSPAAVVLASWTFDIAREVESLNGRTMNAGGSRWRYAAKRDAWLRDLLAIRRVHGIPLAAAKRRVTFTRLYAGRQRELDHGNLVGGMKPVCDAMVRAGLLVDDKPKYLEDHYKQERAATVGLRVLVEELV